MRAAWWSTRCGWRGGGALRRQKAARSNLRHAENQPWCLIPPRIEPHCIARRASDAGIQGMVRCGTSGLPRRPAAARNDGRKRMSCQLSSPQTGTACLNSRGRIAAQAATKRYPAWLLAEAAAKPRALNRQNRPATGHNSSANWLAAPTAARLARAGSGNRCPTPDHPVEGRRSAATALQTPASNSTKPTGTSAWHHAMPPS